MVWAGDCESSRRAWDLPRLRPGLGSHAVDPCSASPERLVFAPCPDGKILCFSERIISPVDGTNSQQHEGQEVAVSKFSGVMDTCAPQPGQALRGKSHLQSRTWQSKPINDLDQATPRHRKAEVIPRNKNPAYATHQASPSHLMGCTAGSIQSSCRTPEKAIRIAALF